MSKFCVQCGTQMEDSAIFCPNCGFKIAPPVFVQPQQPIQPTPQTQPSQPITPETPTVPPITNTPSEQPVQTDQPSPQYQQYQQYTQPQFTQTPPQKKSKKGLIITIVALILLAAIGIASFFILPDLLDNDDDDDDDEKTEETKRGNDEEESTSPDDDKNIDDDDEDDDKDTDESDTDKTPEKETEKTESDDTAEATENDTTETTAKEESTEPEPPTTEPNTPTVDPTVNWGDMSGVYKATDGSHEIELYILYNYNLSETGYTLFVGNAECYGATVEDNKLTAGNGLGAQITLSYSPATDILEYSFYYYNMSSPFYTGQPEITYYHTQSKFNKEHVEEHITSILYPTPTPPAYGEYYGYDTSAEPNNIAVKPKHVYWESDGTLVAVCYVINGFDYTVSNINLKELALSTSQGTFCSGNFGILQNLTLAPYTYAEWTFRFTNAAVLAPFADLGIPVSPYWNIEYNY